MDSHELSQLQNSLHQTRATWTAGHNYMLDLTPEERIRRLGATPPDGVEGLMAREREASEAFAAALPHAPVHIPRAVDWRHHNGHNYVTGVKDQGNCGSCVAFGTSATIDAAMRIIDHAPIGSVKGATLQDVSEAQLFYCSKTTSDQHTCETGWWPDAAFAYAEHIGLAPEACFPYTAGDQPCKLCEDWKKKVTKVGTVKKVTTAADMRSFIATKGPMDTCFTVYDDFFAYQSGVYIHHTGALAGGHCVCCIGYSNTLKAWLCKNSWGPAWGMGGYVWIGYGQCGIDATMWGVETFTHIYHT